MIPLLGAGTLLRANNANNLTATRAPLASDDSYPTGAFWLWQGTKRAWVCTSASPGAAVWTPIYFDRHPGYVAGYVYATQIGPTASSSAVSAQNLLYLNPIEIYHPVTVGTLHLRVQAGGAGSVVKPAIWANVGGRPSGVPLLGLNADTSCASSSTLAIDIADTVLVPGIYWAGAVFSTSSALPTMYHVLTSPLMAAMIGAPLANAPITFASQVACLTTPLTYSNNILTTDLTGATFTAAAGTVGPPVINIGV
jgi:hypothetical protein